VFLGDVCVCKVFGPGFSLKIRSIHFYLIERQSSCYYFLKKTLAPFVHHQGRPYRFFVLRRSMRELQTRLRCERAGLRPPRAAGAGQCLRAFWLPHTSRPCAARPCRHWQRRVRVEREDERKKQIINKHDSWRVELKTYGV
jgi:hypothetical protein